MRKGRINSAMVAFAVITFISCSSTNQLLDVINREKIICGLRIIVEDAQAYYKKAANMGGGGYTFSGWTMHPALSASYYGRYSATVSPQHIVLVGTGVTLGFDGKNFVKITMFSGPNSVIYTSIQN